VRLHRTTPTGEEPGYLATGEFTIILENFEDVVGTGIRDVVSGSEFSNYLFGMSGDDLLFGEGATDFLDGGDGNDVLYGGTWLGLDQSGQGADPTDYEDDGVRDYLVGGTGVEKYYASTFDDITDATIHAVDEAAAAGTRFVADGDGEVYFDGVLLDGGERVAFEEWGNYKPHPDLQIMVVAQGADPDSTNPHDYVQRELFVGGSAESGLLLYRVMNAYSLASDGTQVGEWLLIVELAGTGKAITISGVDYTPGAGIADGFLGIVTSASAATLLSALVAGTGDTGPYGGGMPSMSAEVFSELVAYGTGDEAFDPLAPGGANTGLTNSQDSAEVGPGRRLGLVQDSSEPARSGSDPATVQSAGNTLLAAAAGGGGQGGGGGGGGNSPPPPPPPTGSGFLGLSIVNPEPAADTSGNDVLRGGTGNDTLVATAGDDTLRGSGGNDLLEGGDGADEINGGSGIDTADYGSSYEGVQVHLDNGFGSGGHATGDTLSSIENVLGSAFADQIYGNSGDNLLVGHFGNDYFQGGGGNDTFNGGLGNDAVGFSNDSTSFVSIDLGAGTFGGLAAGHTYISIESFGGTNNAAQGDTLIGSDERNDLYGYGGDDLISGAGGNDYLAAGDGSDTVEGGDGNDYLQGGDAADILTGGAGYDLFGFIFGDSGTTSGTWDVITDFSQGFDFIDLGRIDANSTNGDWFSGPNDGFRWIGTDPIFNGSPGDLRYEQVDGNTHVMGETNGDGVVDFVIVLNGLFDLTIADFYGDSVTDVGSNDPIIGTEENDTITGTDRSEIIYGLGGNDRLYGEDGYDTIYGGDGDDRIEGWLGADELHGEAGNDVLIGGTNNDTLYGGADDDQLYGYEYHDLLYGGDGNDTLNGDKSSSLYAGSDTLYGGAGDDNLWGGAYIDYYDGGEGFDHVTLQDHTDTASGATIDLAAGQAIYDNGDIEFLVSIEGVTATFWDDVVYGDDNANRIIASNGSDIVWAGGGDDWVEDTYTARDEYHGGDGIDTIDMSGPLGNGTYDLAAGLVTYASGGTDIVDGFENLIAGDGSDTVLGTSGANMLDGGLGNDTVNGLAGDDTVLGGIGADVLYGDGGNDILEGGSGDDQHFGGDGDDLIRGSIGFDSFDGGTGVDTLDFSYTAVSATLDLASETVVFEGGQVEAARAFETVVGGGGADMLIGTSVTNQLSGNEGNDTLIGGAGDDLLTGGAGEDVFVFTSLGEGTDTITDFSALAAGSTENDVLRFDLKLPTSRAAD
jgi:Ca2+-binding RTX toxin-like protein